jgi:tetratricopeptide (TPR) repeat protein
MRVEARFMLLVAVACASAMPARAQGAPADNAAARAAFSEGERNFQLGKFDVAIDAYERAFGLDPQPAFLFNIALSHRRQYEIDGQIDHLARARELYRNYLRLEPQATNRAGVEKLISELTAKIDAARGRPEPSPAGAPPAGAPASPTIGTPRAATGGPGPLPGPAPSPSAAQPAAMLSSPVAHPVEPPPSSSRRWVIGGTVAATAVVAAIAIFFITRSGPSFDGPGVNVTDMP